MKTLHPETRTFETDGSFNIILENHGQPAHVHLHIDDTLAQVASLEEPNWYVPAGGIEPVEVTVPDDVTGAGKIEVSTGYGAETSQIDVRVDTETGSEESVETPEEQVTGPADGDEDGRNISGMAVPAVLAVIGVLLAAAVMAYVTEWVAVAIGGLAVLIAIAIAGYIYSAG